MEKGIFTNLMENQDPHWPIDLMIDILSKIKTYADKNGYTNVEVLRVEDSTWSAPANERYDVEIVYTGKDNKPIRQKLLMLKGELLDGIEFHKRFREFYPA